jgi:hypothetical protein
MVHTRDAGFRQILVISLIISILSSAFTSLIVRSASRPSAGADASSTDISRPRAGKATVDCLDSKGLGARISSIDLELTDLQQAVKTNAARIDAIRERRTEEREVKPAKEESSGEKAVREAVRRFLDIRRSSPKGALTRAFEDLLNFGDQAVPFLAEVLRSGTDVDFGRGGGDSGSILKSHATLRSRIIDALYQIGTPEAKKAILQALADPKSIAEMKVAIFLFGESKNPMMKQGTAAMLPVLMDRLGLDGPDAIPVAIWGYDSLFCSAAKNTGLTQDGEFMLRIAESVKRGDPKYPFVGSFLGLLVEDSPESAWRILNESIRRNERRNLTWVVSRIGSTILRNCRPEKFIEFIKVAFADSEVQGDVRSTIYRLCGNQTYSRGGKGEDRAALDILRRFLEDRRTVEQDTKARAVLEDAIRRFEARLR